MFFTEVALVFGNVSKRFTKLNNVEMNKNETNLIYFYTWTIIRWVLAHSLSLSLCLSNEKHMHKNIMMPRAWIGSINEQFQFNELLFDFKDLISEARALEHFFFRIWEWEKTHRAFQKYISTLNERAHRRDVYFINICLIIKFTWELSLPFIKIICFDLIFSWIRFLLCRMRTASELHI